MDTAVDIRPAVASDAGIISRILTRSVRVGCSLDHRNQPSRVEAWTRTRSIGHVLPWLSDPRLYLNLASLHGKPAGVGMARDDGRILLCYVQPEWFRRGLGRALLAGLEDWLAAAGHGTVRLNSTLTAEGFYRHLGYRQTARAFDVMGLTAIPMHRLLAREEARPDTATPTVIQKTLDNPPEGVNPDPAGAFPEDAIRAHVPARG